MTVLSAQSILRLCQKPDAGHRSMIWPFVEKTVSEGRSYGRSSASYDCRIAQTIWLWPFWGRLASTIESFDLPDDVVGEVKDKSSNARIFNTVQNTLIDPGFRGGLTLELTRHKPWPVRIKKGTPICQIVFSWLDEPTELPYRGKYRDQSQIKPTAAIYEK